MAPTVSVVIACWGQAKYLHDSFESAWSHQTYKDREVIIVGDHEACDWADSWGIKSIVDPGYGAAYARNMAIDEAKGEFVVCLDADDCLHPTYLEKTVPLALSAPTNRKLDRHVLVSSHMAHIGDSAGYWDIPPYSQKHLVESNCFHCATLFSKALWAAAGGYSTDIIAWEDQEFWIKCSRHNPTVLHVPERLLQYRIHAAQTTNEKHHLDNLTRAMIYLKHTDLYHNYPGRFDAAIQTIARADDDGLSRIDKRLSQVGGDYLRLCSTLAHQYRRGHTVMESTSTDTRRYRMLSPA